MLEQGADPNSEGEQGSPLMFTAIIACRRDVAHKDEADVIELLLDNGADPNKQNEDGWTALHVAAKISTVEVVQLLISKGARVDALTKNRQTPLHLVRQSMNPDKAIIELLEGH